jgi:hypothetical protein
MEDFLSTLRELEETGSAAIRGAGDPAELEQVRVEYLGRKARLTLLLRSVGELPPERRRPAGAEANRVKKRLLELLEARAAELAAAVAEGRAESDATLPGRERWRGARHPCTLVTDEICEIFKELGFVRARGPEAESIWYNFIALNTPLDHPAVDEQDSFYLGSDVVLRTHTSPVQARVMEKWPPPVRILVPGVVYRRDPFDASHAPAFEPPLLLPVHRALGGGRCLLHDLSRQGVLGLQGDGLDRDHGGGHGGSGGLRQRRIRLGTLHGLRLWDGRRPDRYATLSDPRHPAALRERCPFSGPV